MAFTISSLVWLILLIAFVVVEALTVSLVSIWFAAGAVAALIVSGFTSSWLVQFAVFAVVSAVALAATRPLVKKYINSRTQPTNADMLIGQECLVTEDIDNLAGRGAVSVGGKVWTARPQTDAPIPAGTAAIVLRIEGVKLIVTPACVTAGAKE